MAGLGETPRRGPSTPTKIHPQGGATGHFKPDFTMGTLGRLFTHTWGFWVPMVGMAGLEETPRRGPSTPTKIHPQGGATGHFKPDFTMGTQGRLFTHTWGFWVPMAGMDGLGGPQEGVQDPTAGSIHRGAPQVTLGRISLWGPRGGLFTHTWGFWVPMVGMAGLEETPRRGPSTHSRIHPQGGATGHFRPDFTGGTLGRLFTHTWGFWVPLVGMAGLGETPRRGPSTPTKIHPQGGATGHFKPDFTMGTLGRLFTHTWGFWVPMVGMAGLEETPRRGPSTPTKIHPQGGATGHFKPDFTMGTQGRLFTHTWGFWVPMAGMDGLGGTPRRGPRPHSRIHPQGGAHRSL